MAQSRLCRAQGPLGEDEEQRPCGCHGPDPFTEPGFPSHLLLSLACSLGPGCFWMKCDSGAASEEEEEEEEEAAL